MIEYKFLFEYFGRMKSLILLIAFFLPLTVVSAQQISVNDETNKYVEFLKLDGDQKDKLVRILERKATDLKRLEANSDTGSADFRQKRRNIYSGTEKSVRIILNEQQLELWSAYQRQQRTENAAKIKELRAQGASEEDIKDAQYGIFN